MTTAFTVGQEVEIAVAVNRNWKWRPGVVDCVHEPTKDYFGDLPARIDVICDGERHSRFLNAHPASVRAVS